MTHAVFSPSGADRWMACPGSIRMCADLEDKSSVYAMEGTAAHQLADWCLKGGHHPEERLGEAITVVEGELSHTFTVDQEMVDAVEMYRSRVLAEVAATGGTLEVEVKLRLQDREHEVFGTADALISGPRTIAVFDLKYGKGVSVEAEDNNQLMIYGLMAWARQRIQDKPCDSITVGIVQPRAFHGDGPIREATYEPADILDFALDVHDAVDRAMAIDAPLVPGEKQCRWCRAAGVCPSFARKALAAVQTELSDLDEVVLPVPELLEPGQVGQILERLPLFEQWAKQVREHAHEIIEQGGVIPGWKLVPKRAMRQWGDEAEVESYLVEVVGVAPDKVTSKPTLLSPAQIEKALGKKRFSDDGLEAFIVKRSSGTTLAPATDKRPDASPVAYLDDL